MVSITSRTGTSAGVIFQELPSSKFKRIEPRVTKSRTLDGGVYIDHRGVAEGDRVFEIKARLDQETAAALELLHKNETLVNIACLQGFYLGAISYLEIDNGEMDLTFWVHDSVTISEPVSRYASGYEGLTVAESVTVGVA
jgi:hypothetical protein